MLTQVQIRFAKIEREVIARGIFTSVSDLARKLRRYINAYPPMLAPSSGNTPTLLAACLLTISLRQSTNLVRGRWGGRR
jgi:hypothetical protein